MENSSIDSVEKKLYKADYTEAAQNGAYAGLLYAILYIGLYLTGKLNFFSPWLRLIPFVLAWVALIYFVHKQSKQLGKYISWFSVFVLIFIGAAVAEAIWSGFNALLYNVIDPDLAMEHFTYTRESAIEMMEKMNTPEEAMENALAKIDSEKKNFNYDIWGLLKAFLSFSLIANSVLGAIIALFLRRKKPDFD